MPDKHEQVQKRSTFHLSAECPRYDYFKLGGPLIHSSLCIISPAIPDDCGALSDVRVGKIKRAIDGDSRGRWGASFGETQGRRWRELLIIISLCCMNAAFHSWKRCVPFTTLTESVAEISE